MNTDKTNDNSMFTKEDAQLVKELRSAIKDISESVSELADSTSKVSNNTDNIQKNAYRLYNKYGGSASRKEQEEKLNALKEQYKIYESMIKLTNKGDRHTLGEEAYQYAEELEKQISGLEARLKVVTPIDISKNLDKQIEKYNEKINDLAESSMPVPLKWYHLEKYVKQRDTTEKAKKVVDVEIEKYLEKTDQLNRFSTNSFLGQLLNVGYNYDLRKDSNETTEQVIKGVAKDLEKAINNISAKFDRWVSSAADTLASVMPKIMAGTFGSLETSWESISQTTEDFLSGSTLVKQTDYLNTIANLTNQGIIDNVEQRALLETIKDSTISSFNAMDGDLLRLIRILQTDITAESFGLQAALRTTLNSVFNDSQYLNSMYNTITGAITEAMSTMTTDESLGFMSVLQSWTAGMYESGVSSSTVQKIANAINSLGSGNVSALASDADMQRLMLLAMSRAGLDYADILQTGLDAGTTNELLSSVTEYLAEIASNTSENKVLENAYTNLFGISMSDIRSFSTLNTMDGFFVDSSMLGDALNTQLSELSNRTHASTQISNFLSNLQFSFGKEIAETPGKYMLYEIASALSGLGGGSSNSGDSVASKLMTGVSTIATVAYIMEVGYAAASTLANAWNSSSDDFSLLFGGNPTRGGLAADSSPNRATVANSVSQLFLALSGTSAGSATRVETAFKQLYNKTTSSSEYASIVNSANESGWASVEEDVTNDVLKKLDKTIMENENGEAAIAVSLEGLNDEVLKSFASIFADEDALAETFTGQNNVFGDSLFKYTADSTSNSTK